ncbi:MAG: ATP-binding cassette domain-containing protein, partial [Anaerolineales bacterium]
MAPKVLEVQDLKTRFHTQEGTVFAVNGVSFHVEEGETLGIVGESGCGKSVSVLSVMRLIPQPPGEMSAESVIFGDRDLTELKEEEMR